MNSYDREGVYCRSPDSWPCTDHAQISLIHLPTPPKCSTRAILALINNLGIVYHQYCSSSCQLLNSLSTFTILFKILVCMYVCTMVTCPVLTDPISQPPLFTCGFSIRASPPPLNFHLSPLIDRIQQQYLPKMHLSFPFKRRELFN